MTKEEFIDEANKIHNHWYDYSEVVWVNKSNKVKIICPEHGPFLQKPYVHLKGSGCRQCGYVAARAKADYTARKIAREHTLQTKYGVDNPMKIEDVRTKRDADHFKKYGVKNPMQRKEVSERAQETNLDRYGATSYVGSPEGKERIKSTCRARYGADNFMKSEARLLVAEDMREKSRETQLERYGAEHYAKSEAYREKQRDYKAKEIATKTQNGTLHISGVESVVEQRLKARFGESNVKTQYSSDVYPFYCDFYIVSLDLYIELNIHWSHGGHPYGYGESDDLQVMSWQKKQNPYYENAIQTWTVRDVLKIDTVRANHLNYLMFWREDLWDFDLWMAMDCPVGRDYDALYSYLPIRTLQAKTDSYVIDLKLSNLSKVAKHYQDSVFYANEYRLWDENPVLSNIHASIPLQAFLYQNRYHYLRKLPDQLTDAELLRSFSISGVHRGYTIFDASLMLDFLKRYNIHSVYDPCAGWGERLLACSLQGCSYVGVDVNPALASGYDRLIHDYKCSNQILQIADSAEFCVKGRYDAIITCPPYGNTEIYSISGGEHRVDFDKWWDSVVQNLMANIDVKYFCVQTNQKYRSLFTASIEHAGFRFVEELTYSLNRSSHFTRKNGVNRKKEYESFLIYQK